MLLRFWMSAASVLALHGFGQAGLAQSPRHVDAVNHFEAEVPTGWYRVQQPIIEAYDRELDQRLGSQKNFRYISAYSMSEDGDITYPHVLFQITEAPMNQVSEEALIRDFGAERWKDDAKAHLEPLSDLVADTEFGKATWDATRRRIIVTMSSEVAGVGPIRGISAAKIGSHGVVQIHCYALASDFDAMMPTFQEWIDGVQIEEGYAWRPASESPFFRMDWGRVGWTGLIGGLFGGLGGYLVMRFRKS